MKEKQPIVKSTDSHSIKLHLARQALWKKQYKYLQKLARKQDYYTAQGRALFEALMKHEANKPVLTA